MVDLVTKPVEFDNQGKAAGGDARDGRERPSLGCPYCNGSGVVILKIGGGVATAQCACRSNEQPATMKTTKG